MGTGLGGGGKRIFVNIVDLGKGGNWVDLQSKIFYSNIFVVCFSNIISAMSHMSHMAHMWCIYSILVIWLKIIQIYEHPKYVKMHNYKNIHPTRKKHT